MHNEMKSKGSATWRLRSATAPNTPSRGKGLIQLPRLPNACRSYVRRIGTRAWRQPSLQLPACPLWLMKPEMRPPDSRATRLAPARMPRILAPDAWPTTIEEASQGQPRPRLISQAGAPQHPELRLRVTPATTDRPKELGRARIAIPHPEPGAELSVLDNRDYQCRLPGRSNRAMPRRPSLLIEPCRARDGSVLATWGLARVWRSTLVW